MKSNLLIQLLAFGFSALKCTYASPFSFLNSREAPIPKRDDTIFSLVRRQNVSATIDCNKPPTGLGSDCWAVLDLTQYLDDWVTSHTCNNGETFSACFLRLTGYKATTPPNPAIATDAKAFYVAYNIYSITTFFQRWTLGVRDASTAVNANIPKILEILEYPGLKSALTSGLASLAQQTENNLQVTNDALLSNVTDFEAFASHGNFSTAPSPVADITKYLTFAFNTYIASDALNTNNILAIVARDTNPVALASNGTQLAYPLDCKSYNAQNVCDAWFYSENYRSAFTLDNFHNQGENYGPRLTELFKTYTTGELLFESAYACNRTGGTESPIAGINITVSAAGVNTACITQLRVLSWDKHCHATVPDTSGINCEFNEQFAQQDFWLIKDGERVVPAGYLGPAINRKTASAPITRD